MILLKLTIEIAPMTVILTLCTYGTITNAMSSSADYYKPIKGIPISNAVYQFLTIYQMIL